MFTGHIDAYRASDMPGFPFSQKPPSCPSVGVEEAWNGNTPDRHQEGPQMELTLLAKVCDKKDCPTLYRTDRGTLAVQGDTVTEHGRTLPAHESIVEIPVDLIKKAIADGLI